MIVWAPPTLNHGRWSERRPLVPVVLLAAVALLSAGCATSAGDGQARAGASEDGKEQIRVGFSGYANTLLFYRAFEDGMRDRAAELGIDVVVTDSGFDAGVQVADIEDLLVRGVDLLLVSPGDPAAVTQGYRSAASAGVPVWSFANEPDEQGRAIQETYYGHPWGDTATARFDRMVEEFGGQARVLAIRGVADVDIIQQYTAALQEGFAREPSMELVDELYGDSFAPDEGARLAQDLFTRHDPRDIDIIWADVDSMALGILSVLREAGIDPTSEDAPYIVVGNGGSFVADLLKDGSFDLAMAAPAYTWGREIMDVIDAYVREGESVPERIVAPIELVTPDNVDAVLAVCRTHPKEIYCRDE